MNQSYESLPLFPMLLPSVPFNDLKSLPKESGVYFALSADGDVLYVGATNNLYKRWRQHHQYPGLISRGCALIAYYSCPLDTLSLVEQSMIEQFHPKLNDIKRHLYAKEFHVDMKPRTQVSIMLDEELWKQVQQECKLAGLIPSHYIENFLRADHPNRRRLAHKALQRLNQEVSDEEPS